MTFWSLKKKIVSSFPFLLLTFNIRQRVSPICFKNDFIFLTQDLILYKATDFCEVITAFHWFNS